MSKKYYQLKPAELLVFLNNFNGITVEKQSELGISAAQLDELQHFKTMLENKVNDRQATREAAAAAKIELKDVVRNVTERIGSLNKGFKSNKTIPDSLIELLGLEANDNSLTTITPVAPTDLVVEGRSNGINYLRWKGGGNRSRTTYILEVKTAGSAEYKFVKALTKMRFEHKDQPPGVRAFYRVKAIHSDLESSYSNEAVVYN